MDDFCSCLACLKPVPDDAPCYPDASGILCSECAPTFDMLLIEEAYCFVDADGEPLSLDKRRALYDAHIAAGGRPDDSMAERD